MAKKEKKVKKVPASVEVDLWFHTLPRSEAWVCMTCVPGSNPRFAREVQVEGPYRATLAVPGGRMMPEPPKFPGKIKYNKATKS